MSLVRFMRIYSIFIRINSNSVHIGYFIFIFIRMGIFKIFIHSNGPILFEYELSQSRIYSHTSARLPEVSEKTGSATRFRKFPKPCCRTRCLARNGFGNISISLLHGRIGRWEMVTLGNSIL